MDLKKIKLKGETYKSVTDEMYTQKTSGYIEK